MSTNRRTLLRLALSLVVLAAAVGVLLNRTYIIDQIVVWRYEPAIEIQDIATKGSMNDHGRFLFYASRPVIMERSQFNQHCRTQAEKTAILGCYASRSIYLFNITDPRLEGIKEVTAAHEMLHAAYERLSESEQAVVNKMIDEASKQLDNPLIEQKLALYDTTEPGERYNELHSMLGSEAKNLPADLESYYAQYFTNRLALVSLAERYETVFTELEANQKRLVSELNVLASDINSGNTTYKDRFDILQSAVRSFNQKAENGDFSSDAQFAAERNRLIAQQVSLNAYRNELLAKIADYDAKKAELDTLNLTAEGLQKSIDSNAVPEVPSV